jgi:hypothetical protein
LFLIVCGLEVLARPARWMDATRETAWWLAALTIVLLSSPMTWVMNVIWLIPALPLVVRWACSLRHPWEGRVLAVLVVGLLLAAMPDSASCPLLVPYAGRFLHLKYVAAEVLVAASLLALAAGKSAARES